MIIDDYAYKNKLFKVNPNLKFSIGMLFLIISLISPYNIFIFMEEVADIRTSQELRFGYINLKNGYRSFGLLVNMLFKRMMIRYDEMSIALDMKLFDGTFHIVGDSKDV